MRRVLASTTGLGRRRLGADSIVSELRCSRRDICGADMGDAPNLSISVLLLTAVKQKQNNDATSESTPTRRQCSGAVAEGRVEMCSVALATSGYRQGLSCPTAPNKSEWLL